MDLRTAFENIDAFLRGENRVAVKVRGALFKLGEVFD